MAGGGDGLQGGGQLAGDGRVPLGCHRLLFRFTGHGIGGFGDGAGGLIQFPAATGLHQRRVSHATCAALHFLQGLPQGLSHVIEGAGQFAHFILRSDHHRFGQLPVTHLARCLSKAPEVAGECPCQQQRG